MTSRDALVCVNSSCAVCTYYRFILRGEYIHTKIDPTRCKIENQGRRYNFQSTGPYNLGPWLREKISARSDEGFRSYEIFKTADSYT